MKAIVQTAFLAFFIIALSMPYANSAQAQPSQYEKHVWVTFNYPNSTKTFTTDYQIGVNISNPTGNTSYSGNLPLEFETNWLSSPPFTVVLTYFMDDNQTFMSLNGTKELWGGGAPAIYQSTTNMTIDISGLSDGEHKIVIFAELNCCGLRGGNYSFDPIYFLVKNPPILTPSPTPQLTLSPSPSVPEFSPWTIFPLAFFSLVIGVFTIKRRFRI